MCNDSSMRAGEARHSDIGPPLSNDTNVLQLNTRIGNTCNNTTRINSSRKTICLRIRAVPLPAKRIHQA
jgi:hypothetical protein